MLYRFVLSMQWEETGRSVVSFVLEAFAQALANSRGLTGVYDSTNLRWFYPYLHRADSMRRGDGSKFENVDESIRNTCGSIHFQRFRLTRQRRNLRLRGESTRKIVTEKLQNTPTDINHTWKRFGGVCISLQTYSVLLVYVPKVFSHKF